jgi:hypothetical protein
VIAEETTAAMRRALESLKGFKSIPLPRPFEPSTSFAAAARSLARRQPEPKTEVRDE